MNTLRKTLVCCAFIMIAVFAVSCKNESAAVVLDETYLLGDWNDETFADVTEDGMSFQMSIKGQSNFSSDGINTEQGKSRIMIGEDLVASMHYKFTGSWKVVDGDLVLITKSIKMDKLKSDLLSPEELNDLIEEMETDIEEEDVFKVISISRNKLVLESKIKDGPVIKSTYTRVLK